MVDDTLDKKPRVTIVTSGDVSQLDTNKLCRVTGWNSLDDFLSRRVAFLDKVFTNRKYYKQRKEDFFFMANVGITSSTKPMYKMQGRN